MALDVVARASMAVSSEAAGVRVERLLCDHVVTPIGVVDPPWFSWSLVADGRGAAVRATRVSVEALDGSGTWSSGWIAGTPPGVLYDGPALVSRTQYRWSVEVQDASGSVGRPVSSAFETGMLSRTDWSALWVRRGERGFRYAEPPSDDGRSLAVRYFDPPLYCRSEFVADRPVSRARLYVTARGIYEVLINGVLASDHRLAPGWTDYRDRVEYQSVDVTDRLRVGANAIGAVVTPGWWSGYVGFDRRRQAEHYGTEPQLLLQLHLWYEDGQEEIVCSDADWVQTDGPIRYADLLMGELVDDRADLGDWASPGGADGEWRPVRADPLDAVELSSLGRVPVRACETLKGEVVSRKPGLVLVDFGQNLVGNVRLDVSGLAWGQTLLVRHGESIDADGRLYTENLRTVEATDIYISDGRHGTFEPRFTSHGFRYAEIAGDVDVLAEIDIEAVSVRSDNPEVGALEFGAAGLQRLESNIRWGQRSNFVSVPTDCPQRDERLGWLADAQVFLPTASYNANVAAFFRNWLRDVRYAQDDNGAFPDVAPRLRLPQPGAPAWGDGGVIIPWQLYRWYGDIRFLTDAWASMVAWVEYVARSNPSHIWRNAVGHHYGDWLSVAEETDRDVLATAYFARSARIVQQVASVLGKDSESSRFGQLADQVSAAFRSEFVAPDGSVAGDSQTGYLVTLAFDLAGEELREAVHSRLVHAVERRGPALTTGFIGVGLLLPVLTDIGRPDLAWSLAMRREFPSWLYSVDRGATTIWERWDGWTEERGFQSAQMNSFNHYSLGSIGEWFYSHAAGIRQAEGSVGWARLDMRPAFSRRPGRVGACFGSPRGRIVSAWHYEGAMLHWELEIPPGSSAKIAIPAGNPDGVTESGRPLTQWAGVSDVQIGEGLLTAQLVSGRYEFASPDPEREGVRPVPE